MTDIEFTPTQAPHNATTVECRCGHPGSGQAVYKIDATCPARVIEVNGRYGIVADPAEAVQDDVADAVLVGMICEECGTYVETGAHNWGNEWGGITKFRTDEGQVTIRAGVGTVTVTIARYDYDIESEIKIKADTHTDLAVLQAALRAIDSTNLADTAPQLHTMVLDASIEQAAR